MVPESAMAFVHGAVLICAWLAPFIVMLCFRLVLREDNLLKGFL